MKATTISVEDLMTQSGQVPYTKSLKIQVVAITDVVNYRNDKNESKSLMNAAVVDHSKAVKCTIYDSTKFPRFKEGQYLILRNVIKKTDGVVVTSNTKVFTCAPFEFELPAAIQQRGREILNPPPAPVVNVKEALDFPPKARVTVRGKVVQEEATREVFVTGVLFKEEKTKVKNIYIENTSSRCKVSLWRENTEESVRPGDYVQITDVVTNSYRNEVSLSTTFRTKISTYEVDPVIALASDETCPLNSKDADSVDPVLDLSPDFPISSKLDSNNNSLEIEEPETLFDSLGGKLH
ncbi:uncharacterized protein LOC134259230 [Saccostrea cucullata]|uniref:uncharacterized protein LOC134259230 n=1 Tax=Saccostrea cuccullata TaxID=36930 RepID=UPI002ED500E1